MAESVVLAIALETVRNLLIEEAKFLYGVKDQVEEIERELKRMKIFLEYADSKQDDDKMIRHRVAEIGGLADEVENVLESFAIEVASRKTKGGIKIALKRYVCVFKDCIALHKVGSEVVSIKTKITNLSNTLPIYDIRQGRNSDSTQERQSKQWQRLTFPHFEEDFVGMVDDVRILVSHLLKENKQLQVVSICGMGGLGKTTLAKNVYKHGEVRQYFDHFAWACITQQWKPRDILLEILTGLGTPEITKIENLTDRQLVEKLYEVQQKKKCLIVIDDIWSNNAWDSLRHAFPNGETGSKVLLTTRNKEVALHADPSGFLHEPRCLDEKESWELLQKKAFPRRNDTDFGVDPRMEKLGREMVRRCWGLPLAIIVLGGILVNKPTSQEWEMVLLNIKTYIAQGKRPSQEDGGVSHVLALSYKNLSYQLRRCFLYMGNFQEDIELNVRKLYHMWLAEGIISSDDRGEAETMIDVAERCLGELAQRSMVQMRVKGNWTTKKRFQSCSLHDLMRDLCLSKLKEGNLLNVNGKESVLESSRASKIRIVSSYSNFNGFKKYLAKETERSRQKHTFKVFYQRASLCSQNVESCVNDFKSVRVFDLEGLDFLSDGELSEAIQKLMRLRYLSLRKTYFNKLPSSIRNLVYLQTLDLRIARKVFVPNVLWELQQLRHLYLPRRLNFDAEKDKKLRLDGLSNLETLVNFDSVVCDTKDLLKLKNLRKLKVIFSANLSEDLVHLVTVISSMTPLLRHSNVIIDWYYGSEEEMTYLRKLLGCCHLFKLDMTGCISQLPEYYHFSPNLTKLTLSFSKLEEDPMPTLEKLPSLFSLYIGEDAFTGKEMVCSAMGFPQLTVLILMCLPDLENWRVDEGAFPNLSCLEIDKCKNLKMFPDGLRFVTTLKELNIIGMSEEFKNRLRVVDGKEGEDICKVRHVTTLGH